MKIDRHIGRFFENMPVLRRAMKFSYLRTAYLFAKKNSLPTLIPLNADYVGFFGYYDKSPWNVAGDRFLFHTVVDKSTVGINIADCSNGRSRLVGRSVAWNWQQGARLQWLPGSDALIFNTVHENMLAAKIKWIDSAREHICDMPIQTVHPNGNEALALNYKRLYKINSQYGYGVNVSNFDADLELGRDGIWRFDLFSNNSSLIISLEQLMNISPRDEMRSSSHKVNHIMYSPSGSKFVFMHRWVGRKGKYSRLYVANSADGTGLKLLMDDRMISHYSWRDDSSLIVYGRTKQYGDKYYIVNVDDGTCEAVGDNDFNGYGDGHPSYSPDKRYLVTDTYPDKARIRKLLLYDTLIGKTFILGAFHSPWKFDGANRVDLHPRWSPNGKMISIDSSHEGERKTYVFDIGGALHA